MTQDRREAPQIAATLQVSQFDEQFIDRDTELPGRRRQRIRLECEVALHGTYDLDVAQAQLVGGRDLAMLVRVLRRRASFMARSPVISESPILNSRSVGSMRVDSRPQPVQRIHVRLPSDRQVRRW
jgi:hypothetical protein